VSLDAAGRVEELDRLRCEEQQLLMNTAERGRSELTRQTSGLDIDSLSSEWSQLGALADEKAQSLLAYVSHWNLYQSAVSRLMPCLSRAEHYMAAVKDGSGSNVAARTWSLTDVEKQLECHRVCLFFDIS